MGKIHGKDGGAPGVGRKESVPTAAQTQAITTVLSNFGTAKEACVMAGVPLRTYYLWLEKGRAAREADEEPEANPFLQFLHAVEQSDTLAVLTMLEKIQKAAKEPKHWQAALTLLRIRHPRRFAEQTRIHVDGELNDFLERLEKKLGPELFEQVYEAAYNQGEDGGPAGGPPEAGQTH